MSGPPRLSVSTGAGPSTPNPLRRPQGARNSRRGGAGLFVANPDNSDSDTSPKASPVRSTSTAPTAGPVSDAYSPATTSSQSSIRGVPISAVSGTSGLSGASGGSGGSGMGHGGHQGYGHVREGSGNMSPLATTAHSGLNHGAGPRGVPQSYRMSPSNSAPTVPAPNTPLPTSASYGHSHSQSQSQSHQMPPPSSASLESAPHISNTPLGHGHMQQQQQQQQHHNVPGYPSYPPPQPKRHFTTPIPASQDAAQLAMRAHESRHASVGGSSGRPAVHPLPQPTPHQHSHPPNTSSQVHHSPGRHLPPLPSPSLQSAPLLPHTYSDSAHQLASQGRPSISHAPSSYAAKTASPEDVLSPAAASDGGRSFASGGSYEGRNRSGSVLGQNKTQVQVTMDNEQFFVVDVTGMTTADGIKDRAFAKLRIRDDERAAYSFFRTEIGEQAAPVPFSSDQLLQACLAEGDAKATLKFLVIQNKITGTAASVVPPMQIPMSMPEPQMSGARRLPPIDTQLAPGANRNSKDGSLSSASATTDRHAWSEASHESASASNTSYERQSQGQSQGHSKGGSAAGSMSMSVGASGSSRSLHTQGVDTGAGVGSSRLNSPSTAHSSLNNQGQAATYQQHPHSPIYNQAGPSRPPQSPLGLGFSMADLDLSLDDYGRSTTAYAGGSGSGAGASSGSGFDNGGDEMDEATRVLIEELTRQDREDERAREERRQQMEEDERIARQAQQNERDEWQAMQMQELEGSRRRQEQIERDEQRAREVEAEELRAESERERARQESQQQQHQHPHAHPHLQRREPSTGRTSNFYNERREMQQHWMQMPQAQTSPGTWHQPTVSDGPASFQQQHDRRPSGGRHPSGSSTGYASPVNRYDNRIPDSRYDEMGMRRDTDRDRDPSSQRGPSQAGTMPRSQGRMPHPYGHNDSSLQNARSMDNLRPMGPPGPGSGPGQGPGAGSGSRIGPPRGPHNSTGAPFYYSPSAEDLRFPEQHRTGMGTVPFPSPRPGRQASSSSGGGGGGGGEGWLPYPPPSGPGYDGTHAQHHPHGQSTSPRPNSFHHETGRPVTSPQRRPSTLHDHSPPDSAGGTARGPDYYPPGADAPYFARRGSFESPPVTGRPSDDGMRRTSHGDVPDRESLLPYRTNPAASSGLPRPGSRAERRNNTGDSDNNTVSSGFSELTVRGGGDGSGEGTSTARQGELMSRWRRMVRDNEVLPPEEDEDEATLWITAPKSKVPAGSNSAPLPLSPGRPSLSISTANPHINANSPFPPLASAAGTVDSATESESESASRMHRAKSFAKPKGEAAWHFRPEPEQLYDNLDELFPKVDLDKPIPIATGAAAAAADSAPSTPLEHAGKDEHNGLLPPPVHPTRQNDSRLPQSPKHDKEAKMAPPPHHPAANANVATAAAVSKFNKAENRKSIRSIAQGALKHTGIARYMGDKVFGKSSDKGSADKKSMWGNKNADHAAGAAATATISPSSSKAVVPATIEDAAPHEEVPAEADVEAASFSWVKGQMIGRGSYGKVYIALNVLSGKMMAVKQVELMGNDGDVKQKEIVNALKGEIALLKDLSHPNIVQYLGTETSDTHLSIFLEYVPGGTIASIYKAPDQGAFEEQLVKFFTKQILLGLAYLHGKPIPVLHRDLKGDNILVDANGVCKISDFGISKEASNAYDSYVAGTAMRGTPFWMAPEVVMPSKDKSYSGKADIWSLGCVLVEMWTGTRPWGVSEQITVMLQLAGGKARPPIDAEILRNMSTDARGFLLDRCLSPLPEGRPTAVELLKHPFIVDLDPRWTFADSKTGKAVASQGARRLKQHANAATAGAQS